VLFDLVGDLDNVFALSTFIDDECKSFRYMLELCVSLEFFLLEKFGSIFLVGLADLNAIFNSLIVSSIFMRKRGS
jgi:hypothetical protein